MPLGCVLSPWVDEQKWRESLPKPPVFARLRNSKARLDLDLDISIGPSSAHKPRREVNYKAMPPSKGENCLLAARAVWIVAGPMGGACLEGRVLAVPRSTSRRIEKRRLVPCSEHSLTRCALLP